MRPNRLLLAAALGAALAGPAAAQPAKGLWKPPVAAGTNVTVWRGDRAGIALRGLHGNNPVEYVIDRPPRHGRLSPVAQPDPDRVSRSTGGSVTYAHDGTDGAAADEFTFRVRGLRGGLSAPATVRIDIRDRPPVLLAPAALEFAAAAGETMTLPLELANAGGGVLSVETRAEPPFEILGPPRVELGRGRSTNLTVRYAPAAPGRSDRQVLRPGRNDSAGTQTVLLGRSFAPFEAAAERPEFAVAGRDREARVVLQSRAGSPQEIGIAVEPPDFVEHESRVALEPGGSRTVDFRIPEDRPGARREVNVIFSTPFHRSTVALVAPPVPADLAVLGRELDFTVSPEASLTVTNAGGVPGRFTIEPAAGLKLAGGRSLDSREFTVDADSALSVMLQLDAARPAIPPAELTIHLGRGAPAQVAVKAPAPAPPTAKTGASRAEPVTPPRAPQPWQLNRDVRASGGPGVSRRLEWKTAGRGWGEIRLESIAEDGVRSEYTHAPPPRGWISRLGDRLAGFFRGMVRGRQDGTPDREPGAAGWTGLEIDEAAADDSRRWVLTGQRDDSGGRGPVSDPFRISWDENKLEIAAASSAPARTPSPAMGTKEIPLALEMKSARAETQRHSARVQVVFAHDQDADGYRLEHGINPTLRNPATGLPYAGDFRPAPHAAQVKILGTKQVEHEGRRLTLLRADIDGLDPGTSTTWRVVTMAGGRDRWPTGEFVISTKPPWRIPWRTVLLWGCVAALAGVLYLRWRLNRPPA